MKWKIQVCSIATFRNDHQDVLAEENINANWNIKEMYANGPLVKEYVQTDTHGWTILMEINFFVIFTYLKHSAEIQGFSTTLIFTWIWFYVTLSFKKCYFDCFLGPEFWF